MKYHKFSWILMTNQEESWNIMIFHEIFWFLMISDESSWYFMKYHEISWFIMTHHELWWVIMNRHDVCILLEPKWYCWGLSARRVQDVPVASTLLPLFPVLRHYSNRLLLQFVCRLHVLHASIGIWRVFSALNWPFVTFLPPNSIKNRSGRIGMGPGT